MQNWTLSSRRNVAVMLALVFASGLPDVASLSPLAKQSAVSVSQVKKVYVDSLGDKKGASELREALIARLRKSREIQVVASAGEADAVITGSGEVWVKGHYNTSPRPSKNNEVAIYGGMLSVELKGKNDETLWSYLVTPSKMRWTSVAQDLAAQTVKKLLETLRNGDKAGTAH
jgi:hypothetical protein